MIRKTITFTAFAFLTGCAPELVSFPSDDVVGAAGSPAGGGAGSAGEPAGSAGEPGSNEDAGLEEDTGNGFHPPDGALPPPPPIPGSDDAGVEPECVPGSVDPCDCPYNAQGAATCDADGKYESCICPDDIEGTGGTSSTGGTGGTSGSGGAPSSGGATSQGGAAGSAGSEEHSNMLCTPGDTKTCACVGLGPVGAQVCASDGMSYEHCQCPSQGTGGTGGTGGMSTGGTSGTGGTPSSGGTSGSGGSSSGGTGGTSTGGTGGTGGSSTGGTSGSGGTGGGSSTVKAVTIEFHAADSMPAWSFTHMCLETGQYFPGQACSGTGKDRTCVITVDRSKKWEFWASTGLSGAGSWTPGLDWNTNACKAFLGIRMYEPGDDNPLFHMEKQGSGCHFILDPVGATPLSGDMDGDGSADASDCAPKNPSIAPGLTDICDDGLDEDCSGSALTCGGGGGSTAGLKTISFQVFGVAVNASPLTFWDYTGSPQSVTCSYGSLPDPQTGQLATAVVCYASVDRTKDLEFQIQVGSTWASGFQTPGACQKYLRVYAFDPMAVADYDDSSATNYPQQMWHQYIYTPNTCHLFLPKAP